MAHFGHNRHGYSFKGACSLALLCLTFLFFISCERKNNASGPPEKITIAYTMAATAFLIDIAFTKGYFAEEGLDAKPQSHAFGKLALASVLEGKADLATVADTPIVLAVMNNQPVTTIAAIQTSSRDAAIAAIKGGGIASPADLKGKKIGVTLGTTVEFFVDAYLAAHDIPKDAVSIIDIKPAEMAEALATEKVDAVSVFAPTLTNLEKDLGDSGIFFYDESIFTETFCVTAMQEYAKQHPEAIKKFLKALIRAETLILENPEEAQRQVAQFLKMDKDLLERIWPIFTARVTLNQALLVDFEDQTRWAVQKGLTTRKDMPNYLEFIYVDGLQAVKPEAVTILR